MAMIETVDGEHSNNFDELLNYLDREMKSRRELAGANFKNKERFDHEMKMADHYRRFYQAAIHYRQPNS